ncbi:MAG: DegT/DnrJ/EryC1/StrS aminotransferase family protein [Gemmatimonadota bacterium]
MLNTNFPPWPSFSTEEATAVTQVLASNQVNYWTGNECRAFEREFADWAGVAHAVAMTNGTIALEAALKALRIGPGDEVIVTPRSFFASASCVVSVGAVPVFADVDRDSQNLTAETIAPVITERTRAIILVHLAGMPCDMDPILDLARSCNLLVIEDCAQAQGATYKGCSVGSFGQVGAWSFCQDKILTTGGEGGMVTTQDSALWSFMWSYKDHGKSWDAVYGREYPLGFRWLHETFGTNGRMLEMQAAVGRLQLKRLAAWTESRRNNAQQIWNVASELPGLRVPAIPDWAGHAAYKAYVFANPDALKSSWDRDRIMTEIMARGVPCYTGTCPEIYLEKAFQDTGWRPTKHLPVARELGQTSLMFLVHPTLEPQHIEKTREILTAVMTQAQR